MSVFLQQEKRKFGIGSLVGKQQLLCVVAVEFLFFSFFMTCLQFFFLVLWCTQLFAWLVVYVLLTTFRLLLRAPTFATNKLLLWCLKIFYLIQKSDKFCYNQSAYLYILAFLLIAILSPMSLDKPVIEQEKLPGKFPSPKAPPQIHSATSPP